MEQQMKCPKEYKDTNWLISQALAFVWIVIGIVDKVPQEIALPCAMVFCAAGLIISSIIHKK
jgi:hypothetical protein